MNTSPQVEPVVLDEILSRFGNAPYSREFWESVNKSRREGSDRFEAEEQQSMINNHQLMNKMYTI